MDVQFQITSPNNCDHWHTLVTTPNGVKTFVYTKQELLEDPNDSTLEQGLKFILGYLAKTSNINTLQKAKNFLEGKTFKI